MMFSKKTTEMSPGVTFEYGEAVGRVAIEECKGEGRAIRGYVSVPLTKRAILLTAGNSLKFCVKWRKLWMNNRKPAPSRSL